MRIDTVETKVFSFAELSDKAKEKALDDNRDINTHDEWFVSTYEDFEAIAELLGFDIARKNNGKSPAIYFSGFWSQGDGACFEGSYSYKARSVKAVKAYAPQDKELHSIAESLAELQRKHFYKLEARFRHSGHYYHAYCTSFEIYKNGYDFYSEDSDELKETIRKLMQWLYSALESHYNAITSDEAVKESIEANELEFTEDGSSYN